MKSCQVDLWSCWEWREGTRSQVADLRRKILIAVLSTTQHWGPINYNMWMVSNLIFFKFPASAALFWYIASFIQAVLSDFRDFVHFCGKERFFWVPRPWFLPPALNFLLSLSKSEVRATFLTPALIPRKPSNLIFWPRHSLFLSAALTFSNYSGIIAQ